MERYYEGPQSEFAVSVMRPHPEGRWVKYADAQQAINEVKRERDNYRAVLEGAQYEDIDTIGTQDRDLCLVVGKEAAKWSWKILAERNDAQATVEALQAQLESANALLHKKNCAIGKAETTIEALQRGHSQLQALVRAYCEAKVAFDDGRLREDHHAWKERFNKLELAEAALIDYTMRTLDATTPATKGGDGE